MSNTYDYTQQYQAYQYGMGTQGMANAEYYYPYNQQMAYGYYGNQEAYYANGLQGYYNGYGTTNSSANGSTTTGNGQVNPAGYTHNQTYQG
jgi:hypothetical protein